MARIMVPNDLDAHWMPFTANRQFKANPRLLVARCSTAAPACGA